MPNPVTNEPVALSAAIIAVFNVLLVLNVFTLSVDQVTVINIALVTVLAFISRSLVTPVAKL